MRLAQRVFKEILFAEDIRYERATNETADTSLFLQINLEGRWFEIKLQTTANVATKIGIPLMEIGLERVRNGFKKMDCDEVLLADIAPILAELDPILKLPTLMNERDATARELVVLRQIRDATGADFLASGEIVSDIQTHTLNSYGANNKQMKKKYSGHTPFVPGGRFDKAQGSTSV